LSAYITEVRKHTYDFAPRSWVVPKSVLQKSTIDGKVILDL